ncbi:MAG: 30S ribosomal protein S13 [Pseudomonadales bacterium]|nr:30S ribosomal protein S13 [Candidatus Woesebacteria bacterium]MCB9801729.1 30S ribosomal protein S13 [Pseudomonadales bacterium]
MPRIAGVDIPDHTTIYRGLQRIYGIGPKLASDVLAEANIDEGTRVKDLTQNEVNHLQRILDKYEVEGDLRRAINDTIDRLKRIRSYRGMRHAAKLPARGQRTRTNSRTARGGGRRKTVGSMTKETAAKLDAAKK